MTNQVDPNIVPIGSIISDKYRVERIVGKGGMGVVVAVHHIKLDEPFAIKVLVADDRDRREPVERFIREARAAVKLKNNEHVARVTDVDTLPNGLPYMVMELLDGQDLDKILKERGVFAFHDACSYVVQACSALADAHKLGIIHRDLKPQNLFLTHRRDGSPCIKVLDFGISKHTLAAESPGAIDLTRSSAIFGSAYYMSPEQARSSKNVVPQSDIWSLGVVLYKLLTGRTPFAKKTLLDVYQALLDGSPAPPPSIFRPDIPAALEAVILRCLDKNIANRYPGARELMAALAPFTVPGETNAVDSDTVSTLPLARPQKRLDSSNATALEQPCASGQTHSNAHGKNRGIPFKTQPLDAGSLHAALHAYLPPRPTPRPPSPSQPTLPESFDLAGDDPTPRIVPKSADQPIATRAPEVHGTICVPSMIGTTTTLLPPPRERLSSGPSDVTMTPWNTFPAPAPASRKRIRMTRLAVGAIVAAVILLILWFFTTARFGVQSKPAVSDSPETTALPTFNASPSSVPFVPVADAMDASLDESPTLPPSARAPVPTRKVAPQRSAGSKPTVSGQSDEISDPYPH